jgi:hypothetical protein
MGYQMVDNSLRAVLQLCAYANVPSSPLSARYAAFVDGRTLRRITAAPKGTPGVGEECGLSGVLCWVPTSAWKVLHDHSGVARNSSAIEGRGISKTFPRQRCT